MDFVINDIKHKNTTIDDIPSSIQKDIVEFYKLKKNYYEFLLTNKDKSPTFDYTISGKYLLKKTESNQFRSTYPLQFIEKPGYLVIEVLDDIKRTVLFRKRIYIEESLNLNLYAKELLDTLQNKKYSLSKLFVTKNINDLKQEKYNNELLFENSLINRVEYDVKKVDLEKKYSNLKQNYDNIKQSINNKHIELDVITNIIKEKLEKKDRLFSNLTIKNTYLYNYITSNKFNELLENIKNKPIVYQYYILNKILYQTKDDSFIPGSICTDGNDIFIINNITSEGILELTKHDLTKVELEKSRIHPIQGLHYQIKDIDFNIDLEYISIEEYKNILLRKGLEYTHNTPTNKIIIENIIGESNYVSSKVKYLTKSIKETKTKIKKQPKHKKTIQEKSKQISYTTKNKYIEMHEEYDNVTLLVDNSTDVIKSDLVGYHNLEKIDDKDKLPYSNLNSVGNWRQMISNNYLDFKAYMKINPIIIDNMAFSSVKHYEYYCMYYNNPGLGGEKKRQHNDFATKFRLDNEKVDTYAFLIGDKLDKVGNNPDYDKNSKYDSNSDVKINGNNVTYRELAILKAMFAKFNQNANLRTIFLYTHNAHLIERVSQDDKYISANMHMFIRHLLVNKIKPSFYPEYDNDYIKFLQYNGEDGDLEDKLELESRDDLTDSPSKTTKTRSVDTPTRGVSDIVDLDGPELSSVKYSPGKTYKDGIVRLTELGLYNDSMTEKEVLSKLHELALDESRKDMANITGLMEEIKTLETSISNKEKTIYKIPGDGDCLYYAITELMILNNIHPLDFKEDRENQYNRSIKKMNIEFGGSEPIIGNIHNDAAMQMRAEIANKFNENFIVDKTESGDREFIESLKIDIMTQYNAGNFDIEIKDRYYNSILKSASIDSGKWGGDLEVNLASALYNLDISVYLSNGEVNTIKYAESSKIFNKGKKYNTDVDTKHIELGLYMYGMLGHYIGILDKDSSRTVVVEEPEIEIEELSLESYILYNVTVDIEDNSYILVFHHIDRQSPEESEDFLVGILDKTTDSIEYIDYDIDMHNTIADVFDTIERTLDNRIEYQIDKENNVFLILDGGIKKIGLLDKIVEIDSDNKFPKIKFE